MFSEITEFWLAVAVLLMISELVLHGGEVSELALYLDMHFLLVLFLLILCHDFSAFSLVHVPDAVGFMEHEFRFFYFFFTKILDHKPYQFEQVFVSSGVSVSFILF